MHRQESTTLVDTPGSQLIGHNKMNLSCSSKTNIAMGPFKICTGTRVPWLDTAPGNYLNQNDQLTAITSKLVTCYCIYY